MLLTCSGLASSATFNFVNASRTSSNFVLACSKSKSLSNLIVVFGRPLLFWFWRNGCYIMIMGHYVWRGWGKGDGWGGDGHRQVLAERKRKIEKKTMETNWLKIWYGLGLLHNQWMMTSNLLGVILDVVAIVGYYCVHFDYSNASNFHHDCLADTDCCADSKLYMFTPKCVWNNEANATDVWYG